MSKIAFIGLGKLGLPCAEVIAKKGHAVLGYDTRKVESDYVIVEDNIKDTVKDVDIVFVSVPTPHEPQYDGRYPTSDLPPKDFAYDIVESVLTEANKHMNKNQLLVLISTVLPGTVRHRLWRLCGNTRFVYNPYLIAMGTVAWDMVNPEMIMIGTHDGSKTGDAKQLVDLYETIVENNPRYEIGTWDECECIKVFYNTFISAKIGLVNMIQDVAERQGNINVDVVTNALAHSDKRIMGPGYMKAGMGDGGACHPRDNIALRWLSEELRLEYDLFDSVMYAREIQAKNMAETILEHGNRIMFTSNSYKPDVDYVDGSYSVLVQFFVTELEGDVVKENPDVIVRVHETDPIPHVPGATIFDPWRVTPKHQYDDMTVVHYGNTRIW